MMTMTSRDLVRKAWVDACVFHPMNDREVLDHVVDHAKLLLKAQERGVVLLDLDSTLYEVGPRTWQILKEFKDSSESRPFPKVREALDRMTPENVGYSLLDTFHHLGLHSTSGSGASSEIADALKVGKSFWAKRFFTNEYLSFDHAYPGAAEFVQEIYETGADVIYLTGRDEPGMGHGTRDRLMKDGFPFDRDRTELILKAQFHIDDLEHKSKATDYVKTKGKLIASFENEPPNVVAIHDIFPESLHVFMDSVYSDRPADPRNGLYRITSFPSRTSALGTR